MEQKRLIVSAQVVKGKDIRRKSQLTLHLTGDPARIGESERGEVVSALAELLISAMDKHPNLLALGGEHEEH